MSYVYNRTLRKVIPKNHDIHDDCPDIQDDRIHALSPIVPEPIITISNPALDTVGSPEPDTGSQMILRVSAHREDPERLTIETEHVVSFEHHQHVVHGIQAQLAEQARRIAQLEAENDLWRSRGDEAIESRRWAVINLGRVTDKLEATRAKLAHVIRAAHHVIRAAQRGNERQARRIKRLRWYRQIDAEKLAFEQRRLNSTISAQRETLAEGMATYVVHFDSSKGEKPRIDQTELHSSINAITVDDATGEVRLIKSRPGVALTDTTIERLTSERDRAVADLAELRASYDAVVALLESHTEQRKASELQSRKALVIERIAHDLTRLANDALNFTITGLKAENDLLIAQRDAASARVNRQGRELIELRNQLNAANESREALENHAVVLRDQVDWNESRWREAAKRSDEQRMAHQETKHRYNPDAILAYDSERSQLLKLDAETEDQIAWCIRSSMDKPHQMPVYIRDLIRDMRRSNESVDPDRKPQIGDTIEITTIEPCVYDDGEPCDNPPIGYRTKIIALDWSDQFPVAISFGDDDDDELWLKHSEYKLSRDWLLGDTIEITNSNEDGFGPPAGYRAEVIEVDPLDDIMPIAIEWQGTYWPEYGKFKAVSQ